MIFISLKLLNLNLISSKKFKKYEYKTATNAFEFSRTYNRNTTPILFMKILNKIRTFFKSPILT